MITKSTILILAIVFAAATEGSAIQINRTSDLEPEDGIYSWNTPDPYHLALRNILIGEHQNRICQMLFYLSFRLNG